MMVIRCASRRVRQRTHVPLHRHVAVGAWHKSRLDHDRRGVLLGGFNPRDRARSHVELTAFELFSVFVVYTERLDSTRDAEGVFGTSGDQCGHR